jgi:hypothetical protein
MRRYENVPGGVSFWFELEDASGSMENEEQEEAARQDAQPAKRPPKAPNVPMDGEWVSAEDK